MSMLSTTAACSLATKQRLIGLCSTLDSGRSILVVEVPMGCLLLEHAWVPAPDLANHLHPFDAPQTRDGLRVIRSDPVTAIQPDDLRHLSSLLSHLTRTIVVLQMPHRDRLNPELARSISDEEAIDLARTILAEHGHPVLPDLATLLPLRSTDWPWRETRAEVARIRCLLGTARQDALDEVAAALVAGDQGAADILAAFGRSTITDQ